MDEAQIKALLAAALEEHGKTILTQVDAKNQGLAAAISRETKKLLDAPPVPADSQTSPEGSGGNLRDEAPAPEGKLTLKALQTQLQEQTALIQQLKSESDRKDQETFTANRNAALSSAIAGAKTLNPSLLEKVLRLEYGDNLKHENGGWFVQQGDKVSGLNDALTTYLQTDEGKAFLPPSGTQGAGSTESNAVTLPPAGAELKASEALTQAFSGF